MISEEKKRVPEGEAQKKPAASHELRASSLLPILALSVCCGLPFAVLIGSTVAVFPLFLQTSLLLVVIVVLIVAALLYAVFRDAKRRVKGKECCQ